jgi:hypothetical protein
MSIASLSAKLSANIPLLLLITLLVVGVWLAYRHWRDLHEDDEPLRDIDRFAEFERGDAASLMTEAEFRRVRERLMGNEAAADRKRPGPRAGAAGPSPPNRPRESAPEAPVNDPVAPPETPEPDSREAPGN